MQSEMREIIKQAVEVWANSSDYWDGEKVKEDITQATTALTDLICRKLEGMRKHADSFVKDGRERLLAVGHNSAIDEAIKLVRGNVH